MRAALPCSSSISLALFLPLVMTPSVLRSSLFLILLEAPSVPCYSLWPMGIFFPYICLMLVLVGLAQVLAGLAQVLAAVAQSWQALLSCGRSWQQLCGLGRSLRGPGRRCTVLVGPSTWLRNPGRFSCSLHSLGRSWSSCAVLAGPGEILTGLGSCCAVVVARQ